MRTARHAPAALIATVAAAGAAGTALLAWGEVGAWRASRREYPAHPTPGPAGEDVVLVLGYPPRGD